MNEVARRTIATAAILSLAAASTPSIAADPCFQPAEIEADQGVRYQAELMVLSNMCGGDFYRDFTVRNRDQIVSYQHQLMERFRRAGASKPEATLDSFLTRVANEVALENGRQLRATVCSRSATEMAGAKTLDREQYRARAVELATAHQSAYRRCK